MGEVVNAARVSEHTGRIRSVNVGAPVDNPAKSGRQTGIGKQAVGSAELRAPGPKHGGLGSGVVGDFIGDGAHHGGDDQAVYAFAREELDYWAHRLGHHIPDGHFGENLTLEGIFIDQALIGDQLHVGDQVVLEVTTPRIPCATFAAKMGVPGWLKLFTEVGNTGAYLKVVAPGTVHRGDVVRFEPRADHGITVPILFRSLMGSVDAARHVLDSGMPLTSDVATDLHRVAARQGNND